MMTREKLIAAIKAMPEEEFEIKDLIERVRNIYKLDKEEDEEAAEKESKIAGAKHPQNQN